MTSPKCPACGEPAAGPFCRSCGAATGVRTCGKCGQMLPADARFCTECGAASGPGAGPGARATRGIPVPLLVGGLVVIVGLVLMARQHRPAAAGSATPAAATAGTPPDISNMSPRERFDRLYNRSMQAVESGDTGTFGTFAPMALLAYAQLDTVDADARYHAAMLKLHTGDVPGAASLADSILASSPGHLFGYVIQAAVARWQKDTAAVRRAERQFLDHYQGEMAAGRTEYEEHKTILDATRTSATQDLGAGGK